MGGDALLTALYAACRGLIEVRAMRKDTVTGRDTPRGRDFVQPGDAHGLTEFFGSHLDDNVYMGIATRKDASSGALVNCAALGALFVDIDFKVTSEEDARHRLFDFALPPSAAVLSGGRPGNPRAPQIHGHIRLRRLQLRQVLLLAGW